ncbi:MAG: asparaginase domain-containing protein [Flavobacteriaceae bacterium]
MIQIFITGGTFDKSYNYIEGNLYFQETHLPEMLKRSRCQLDLQIQTLMMLDSLELETSHRLLIRQACTDTPTDQILITHGTDTIVESAAFLAQEKLLQQKTIVLTGAMIPYAFGSSSDGFFNLGCALSFVQTLERGVYVVMHGQYFHWNEVQKNKTKGRFERTKQ